MCENFSQLFCYIPKSKRKNAFLSDIRSVFRVQIVFTIILHFNIFLSLNRSPFLCEKFLRRIFENFAKAHLGRVQNVHLLLPVKTVSESIFVCVFQSCKLAVWYFAEWSYPLISEKSAIRRPLSFFDFIYKFDWCKYVDLVFAIYSIRSWCFESEVPSKNDWKYLSSILRESQSGMDQNFSCNFRVDWCTHRSVILIFEFLWNTFIQFQRKKFHNLKHKKFCIRVILSKEKVGLAFYM